MFNYEFNNTSIHDDYRKCDIIPIFKDGDLDLPENFRPISLNLNFWLIMEMAFNHKVNYDDK